MKLVIVFALFIAVVIAFTPERADWEGFKVSSNLKIKVDFDTKVFKIKVNF